ncbi:MAG: hypothetical protein OSB70_18150 [Myxococcota bacterium]|nr:hypothetical protein [Myxococcota bacterium]
MSSLGAFCVLLGLLTLLTRVPLALSPERTFAAWRKLVATRRSVRLSGLIIGGLGFFALSLPLGGGLLPILIWIWGALASLVALGFLAFPQFSQDLALALYEWFERSLSVVALRALGVVALIFGAGLIYLGLYVV